MCFGDRSAPASGFLLKHDVTTELFTVRLHSVLKKKVINSVPPLCFRSLKTGADPVPKHIIVLILLTSICQMMEKVHEVHEFRCDTPSWELTELIKHSLVKCQNFSGHMAFTLSSMKIHKNYFKNAGHLTGKYKNSSLTLLPLCLFLRLLSCSSDLTPTVLVGTVWCTASTCEWNWKALLLSS